MEMRTVRIVCALLLGLITDLFKTSHESYTYAACADRSQGGRGIPFRCETPPSGIEWCLNEWDQTECTSVVKELCERTVIVNGVPKVERLRSYTTGAWEPGVLVTDNCNSIPSMTAVANFFGPGRSFDGNNFDNGHAAIFIRCLGGEKGGIEVYDQTRDIKLERHDRYATSSHTFNGSSFYTIDIKSTTTPLFNRDESSHPCRLRRG